MKKVPTLVIDDADDDEDKETTVQQDKTIVASAVATPRGYLNLGYLLMKYLIVLPKKRSDRDGYIMSYLLKAGAQGIAAVDLVKKSRSEMAAESKAEKELGVSRRTDMILAAKRSQDIFQTKQMSYQLELKAIATSHRYNVACHRHRTRLLSCHTCCFLFLQHAICLERCHAEVRVRQRDQTAVGKTEAIRKAI